MQSDMKKTIPLRYRKAEDMISIDADAVADAVDVAGADVQRHTATHGPTQLHNDCTATG